MKIRIVIPKPSMSCPTSLDDPRVGPVRAGSGQATLNAVGANRCAWSVGATPRRASRSAMASAVEAWRMSAERPAGRVVVRVEREDEVAVGRAVDVEDGRVVAGPRRLPCSGEIGDRASRR